jgi:hypothetical protein
VVSREHIPSPTTRERWFHKDSREPREASMTTDVKTIADFIAD